MSSDAAPKISQFIDGCVNGYTKVDINNTNLTLSQYAYTSTGSFYGVIDIFKIYQSDFMQAWQFYTVLAGFGLCR